jgi:diadenosine tetraphosphate (Ap4A) HIT family hydrolase
MHFEDVTEMPEDIYIEFCSLARHLGRLVKKAFPDTVKINWALCGNVSEARHPHLHILPRHVGDRHWPAFFLDYVQPYWPLEDPRYKMTINALTVLPAKI